jgi:SpoVK/Ycf46/Vps4 family AAA+-type ATPase
MTPVRSLDKVRLWVEVSDKGEKKFAPVRGGQEEEGGRTYFRGDMQELKNKGHLIFLETTHEDFLSALKSSKPSVSSNDLTKYIEFTKNFGMDG